MVADGLEIDTRLFSAAIAGTLRHTAKPIEAEVISQVKGMMTEVIKYTPPRQGDSAAQAQKKAEAKMGGDLRGRSSQGYRGSRRAGIFTVLPDDMINFAQQEGTAADYTRLWTTKDGRVYGVQNSHFRPNASMSELRAHHKRYFRHGQMSRAGTFERSIGRWKWIDQMVIRESTFNRYLREQKKNIYFYAAGFAPGLARLGMPVPRGMARQKAQRGSVLMDVRFPRVRIEIVNSVGWPRIDRDVRRRVQWAANVQAGKMERRLPYLIRAAAKRARLDSA